ncbi:hypothetical protein BpHYR1_001748 [Brachionus plicatilis]|uniref:CIDE-N domain-containing protein n=1 Tax=Brachionus plicatilis TaxID=10195 RepID=A0A3M7RCE0_BRAPC|nr:hypothetical protein BpHYR1_001748 [Brachionus plicatilis]
MVLIKLISSDQKTVKLLSADNLESFLVKAEQKLGYKIESVFHEIDGTEILDENNFKILLDNFKEITLIASNTKLNYQENQTPRTKSKINPENALQIQNLDLKKTKEMEKNDDDDDGIKYFFNEYQHVLDFLQNIKNELKPKLVQKNQLSKKSNKIFL